MDKDIKRIKQNTFEFNKADEQKEIKRSYFKGCGFCDGWSNPCIPYYELIFHIKKDKLQIKDNLKNKKALIELNIQFCPNCGKQLTKELDKYID